MTHHPSAASLRLHGARLLFPPVGHPSVSGCLPVHRPRRPEREIPLCSTSSPRRAYLLAWGLLFLVWMAVDWLTRFAPLATLLSALLGRLPATVDFLHPAAQGRALPPVGFDAGVRGRRRGSPRRASTSRRAWSSPASWCWL